MTVHHDSPFTPAPHSHPETAPHPTEAQSRAPYAEALAHAADRNSLFLSTPGHGGTDEGISAGQAEFFGEHTLSWTSPRSSTASTSAHTPRRTKPCTWPPRLGARGGPGS